VGHPIKVPQSGRAGPAGRSARAPALAGVAALHGQALWAVSARRAPGRCHTLGALEGDDLRGRPTRDRPHRAPCPGRADDGRSVPRPCRADASTGPPGQDRHRDLPGPLLPDDAIPGKRGIFACSAGARPRHRAGPAGLFAQINRPSKRARSLRLPAVPTPATAYDPTSTRLSACCVTLDGHLPFGPSITRPLEWHFLALGRFRSPRLSEARSCA
jgi:hypothetical protein